MDFYDKRRADLQNHFQEILKVQKSPHSIAMGFSLGTLIGIFPTPGLSYLFGFILLIFFPNISKISMIFAFIIWNPFDTATSLFITANEPMAENEFKGSVAI